MLLTPIVTVMLTGYWNVGDDKSVKLCQSEGGLEEYSGIWIIFTDDAVFWAGNSIGET